MVHIVRRAEMPAVTDNHLALAWFCHGGDHAGLPVSLVINETAPGNGPRLHTHDYDELFVVAEGQSTFTINEAGTPMTFELRTGDVALVPAGTPHGFTNSGERLLRQVDIHLTQLMTVLGPVDPDGRPTRITLPRGTQQP
jgi:mannose-6-phosphate isomerase-like protein (cupin superfamily)